MYKLCMLICRYTFTQIIFLQMQLTEGHSGEFGPNSSSTLHHGFVFGTRVVEVKMITQVCINELYEVEMLSK